MNTFILDRFTDHYDSEAIGHVNNKKAYIYFNTKDRYEQCINEPNEVDIHTDVDFDDFEIVDEDNNILDATFDANEYFNNEYNFNLDTIDF